MRYAMVMAGGSGTRLWPMSRAGLPKQLIPFIEGKSLLQLAMERLDGLVPREQQYICAGEVHRDLILRSVPNAASGRFYGEPQGRDTLNAVGLVAAELCQRDPEAVVAVFTADHIIQPVARFHQIVETGYRVATQMPQALVTFGITPTQAATGYGYLELGQALPGESAAFVLRQFKEKPQAAAAQAYLAAGPRCYLWNSGMFVWRAAMLMDCIRRYAPRNYEGLLTLAQAWRTSARWDLLAKVYPELPKISVDYAVMEPASKDPTVKVVAVPMPLEWLDVGSWPAFAGVCTKDEAGNAISPSGLDRVLVDSRNNLVASSDPGHVVTAIGVENLIIIHTPDATLVCRADRAEDIKKLHKLVGEKFGSRLV